LKITVRRPVADVCPTFVVYPSGRVTGVAAEHDPVGPPKPSVLETEMDGDISLYDPASERVTVLNATASDVWRLVDGERSAADITGLLASAYGVAPGSIADDVSAALRSFEEAGLLGGG